MIKLHKKAKIGTGIAALALGLFVGGLATLPFGAQAFNNTQEEKSISSDVKAEANKTPTGAEVKTTVNTTTTTPTTETPVEEPTPTPVPEVTEPEEAEVPVEETDPATVANLQAAIAIAAAEHTDVDVVAAKVKTLGAETVYKITFADGWRIYVSADDGELVVVKDSRGNHHDARNRARAAWLRAHDNWNPWAQAFRNWSKKWVDKKDWKIEQPTMPTMPQLPEGGTASADGQMTITINGQEYVVNYQGTVERKQ